MPSSFIVALPTPASFSHSHLIQPLPPHPATPASSSHSRIISPLPHHPGTPASSRHSRLTPPLPPLPPHPATPASPCPLQYKRISVLGEGRASNADKRLLLYCISFIFFFMGRRPTHLPHPSKCVPEGKYASFYHGCSHAF